MNYLEKFIIEQNKKSEDIIRKAFPMPFEEVKDEIIKAKRAQIGEVREWGGVKMRKEANGWVPVKDGSGKPKGEETPSKEGGETPSIEEHAKKASEAALQNAIKNSPDPEVRAAAHRELERRNKEEKSEMFGKPEGEKEAEAPKEETKPETKTEGPEKKEASPKPESKKEEPKPKKLSVKVENFLDAVKIFDNKIKLDDITVEGAPRGGWVVYHKGKELGVIRQDMLDEDTIDEYELRHMNTEEEPAKEDKNPEKKEETRKFEKELDYDNIREWVGDVADDKSINLIYNTLVDYDLEGDFLKVKRAGSSPLSFSNAVYSKIDDIMDEVRDGEWPSKLKNSEVRDVLWGMIMSESTRIKKSILEDIIDRRTTYKFLEGQSNLLQKSHINEFVFNDNFSVGKTGLELKKRFEEQLKLELEEIRENSRKAMECLKEIGEQPTESFEDEYYYMIDGYEDKIQQLPMVFKNSYSIKDYSENPDNKREDYNSFARKIVDGMIEVIHLNTLINSMVDGKTYKLNIKQASILGF